MSTIKNPSELKIKIFADGADLANIKELSNNPLIKGFTTNPTLMRKANVKDYRTFAIEALALVTDLPICFEVLSDEFREMEQQAREIASWGHNVYVKIPVTNTRREFAGEVIRRLSADGIQVNVTALMTAAQVEMVASCLDSSTNSFVSVFGGRIADTGVDPTPTMKASLHALSNHPNAELIWASPRELLNLFEAESVGCHIITITDDLLAKLPLINKDLDTFSLETVQMFWQDAVKAGFTIPLPQGISPGKRM